MKLQPPIVCEHAFYDRDKGLCVEELMWDLRLSELPAVVERMTLVTRVQPDAEEIVENPPPLAVAVYTPAGAPNGSAAALFSRWSARQSRADYHARRWVCRRGRVRV